MQNLRLATIESDENNSVDLRIYHSDHLGSSSVVANSRNEVVSETVYYPFGDDYRKTGEDIDYKYNGKERDETDLYYYGARYYDPLLCRFISVDPVEGKLTLPQTLNSYSYCINNPLKYIDPDGREFRMRDLKTPEYCNPEDQRTIAKILRGLEDWVGLTFGPPCDLQNVVDSVMPDPAIVASNAGKSFLKKILGKISDFFNGAAKTGSNASNAATSTIEKGITKIEKRKIPDGVSVKSWAVQADSATSGGHTKKTLQKALDLNEKNLIPQESGIKAGPHGPHDPIDLIDRMFPDKSRRLSDFDRKSHFDQRFPQYSGRRD